MSTTIQLYSDFVCPFCFIAEHAPIAELVRKYDVAVEWRGFELHPETPAGGMPLTEIIPASRLQAMQAHVTQFAAGFGIGDFHSQPRIANTRRALAAAEYARSQGKLDEFREAAFTAYWRQGRDLEDDGVLAELAGSVGLDGAATVAATRDPVYLGKVDEARHEAKSRGVNGIPTLFFGKAAVVGCQPFAVLERAAKAAGARLRSQANV